MKVAIVLLFVGCCILLFVGSAVAQTAATPATITSVPPAARAWDVKFVAGPSWPGDTAVQLSASPEAFTLTAFGRKHKPLTPLVVPMKAIRAIVYSPTQFRRGESMGSGGFANANNGDPQAAALYDAGYILVALFASGMKGQKHFINVEWEQDGVVQELMIEAPKETAAAIALQLEQVAGSKWMNLLLRSQKALARLEAQKVNAIHFTLDKPAAIARFQLQPGAYAAVLLENATGVSELYLFSGDAVVQSQLKAITVVDVLPAQTGVTAPRLQLSNASPPQLTEVQMPSKTLHLH